MKELKDYLHLYLGCQMLRTNPYSIFPLDYEHLVYYRHCGKDSDYEIKLFLRPLSDMNRKEKKELAEIIGLEYDVEVTIWTPNQFVWLLSKHFDLFNLHEEGLCLYKTDLK